MIVCRNETRPQLPDWLVPGVEKIAKSTPRAKRVLGMDVGQAIDPSALALVECSTGAQARDGGTRPLAAVLPISTARSSRRSRAERQASAAQTWKIYSTKPRCWLPGMNRMRSCRKTLKKRVTRC